MPPNNRSKVRLGNINSDNENEMMAVNASQAAAKKILNHDPREYRDRMMATTNTYGWNTVETGAPVPPMPNYPAPLPPHKNTKLPLNQKTIVFFFEILAIKANTFKGITVVRVLTVFTAIIPNQFGF